MRTGGTPLHLSDKTIWAETLNAGGEAPRVLYLPNEAILGGENQQVGGRLAFQQMTSDDTIEQLQIYSFLGEYYRKGRDREAAHRELLEQVRAFQPDIIFWSHPDDYPITDELIQAIRECGSNPLLAYHEGDPFDRLFKRLRSPQKVLYRRSDVFFTVGLGEARRLFDRIRPHRRFYYSPTYTEVERFGEPAPVGQLGSRYEAVMIGNIAKRMRVLKHPGSHERVQLAKGLKRLFGDRFACFGRGWPKYVNSQGPLRHVQQREIVQSSRMSLMWEHFPDYTFYFSDRLPIALAAGVPFITSTRPGYETLFRDVPGLFHVSTVEDALDVALYLHSLPLHEIAEMGSKARAWVAEHLDAKVVFRRMVQICLSAYRERLQSGEAWRA